MNRSELMRRSRRELYEMAKAYEVPGRSRMTKDELAEALSRVSARRVAPPPREPKRRMSKRRVRRRRVMVHSGARYGREGGGSYAPRARAEQPQVYVDRGPELPLGYNQDKIVAMVRDPNWLYLYWDLSGGARERLSRKAAAGAWILRVHNLSAGTYEDVPVLIEGGNWYLPVASDTDYRVDIGILGPDGKFYVAASTKRVRMPRMGISQMVDEEWLVLEDEFRQLMEMSDGFATRFSGSRFLSEVITGKQRARMHSAAISSVGGSRRR